MKAWIIDDDKIVCTLVNAMLKSKGFDAEIFNSQKELVDAKLKTENSAEDLPSLVLIDLQLGEDYGKEVYKEILTALTTESINKIKFVFMSSNSREESEQFHNLKEEDFFLQKPFKSADLIELLGL